MDDKKNTDNDRQGGMGRTNFLSEDPHDQSTQQHQRDISDIDRQEGTMHHGVKGGNFDDHTDVNESKEKNEK